MKRLLEFIPNQPPDISVNELAYDTEMRRSWIYKALGMLQVQGLIVLKEGNGSKYFPTRILKIDPKQSA